jgi:hypothetical protein
MNTLSLLFTSKARLPLTALALAASLSAAPAHAALTFGFIFQDPLPAAVTAERRIAVETAGALYSQMFATHFSNTATINLAVTFLDNPNSPELMSAGTLSEGPNGFGNSELTRLQALGAVSSLPAVGILNVNFGYKWELNPNSVPDPADTFDFYAAFNHELTHALGYSSGIGLVPDYNKREWAKWDQFMVDSQGRRLVNDSFELQQVPYEQTFADGSFFAGPNAMAANGGKPVAIDGSYSHINPNVFPADIMRPGRGFGPDVRELSAVDLGIMKDLGYTSVSAVPEPGTYAMVLVGLGFVSFAAKRRKS